MKTCKFIFFIAVTIILKSCGFEHQNQTENSSNETSLNFFDTSQKTYEFKDPKSGILVSKTSYPSNWNVLTKAEYNVDPLIPSFRYQIKDSDGLQAFNTSLKLYYAGLNKQHEQMMRNNGVKNIKSLVSPQQLVQSEIAPKLQGKGFSFEQAKTFPELEKKALREAQKNSSLPFEISITGTTWKNNNGQKALVILNYGKISQPSIDGQTLVVWMYSTDILISNEKEFDTDVNNFVKANLENEPTREWDNHMANIRAKRLEDSRRQTQLMNQRTQQMVASHQQRMANQQAAFNAHQQKMKGIYAANDASHASFMNRTFGSGSASSSYGGSTSGHQNFLNSINEEETVYNPGDGNNYQIQSGAKETWMDSEGNYINSNDLFFDPNASNTNNTNWSKVWEDY